MAIVLLSFAPLALWHQEMPSSPPDAPANPEINEAQVSNLQGQLDGIMAKIDSLEKIAKDGSDLEKVMSMLKKFKDVGAETSKTAENTGNFDDALILSQNNQPFFDDRPISFTHIPKCSGTSFRKEIKPEFAEQNCYSAMRKDSTSKYCRVCGALG